MLNLAENNLLDRPRIMSPSNSKSQKDDKINHKECLLCDVESLRERGDAGTQWNKQCLHQGR